VCIVLDENDKPIGNFSKKICECCNPQNQRHPSIDLLQVI
jgi:hypothetical protein